MAAEAPKQQSPPLKYTVTHNRKPTHTHEEFIAWLVNTHLPLALPVLKKHGVLGYELFVTPPFLSTALAAEMAVFQPTWDVSTTDCFIEYTIPDMQSMKDVVADPDWGVATRDQDEWVEMSKSLVSLGFSTSYLSGGEIVKK
ncbi:uncharacterized protein LY89DRAFT_689921 [Mollisia scopiformis]|uniref:EthD domain-containing protein n=1 Tax=Mollisia scopiformis TaxID=149040 RepID=A0A132BCC4_MOLSC|nr:uncharacterized protein LY89DRAFT_689921 [Mollisia scopiformis]KUJ10080.1 hypothetical protein LY89DRAFT_689921 [Mollisia scopiformis]